MFCQSSFDAIRTLGLTVTERWVILTGVTWNEVIRKLKAAGFVEDRTGKGSHLKLVNPTTGKEVWVTVHGTQDAGHLGNRILRDAGVL